MGVQVRIPTPGRFMPIRDRHHPRQTLQVLLLGHRVVHPGVPGVGSQILHRLGQRGRVRVGESLRHHVVGLQRTDDRDALRGTERQIEPMHPLLAQRTAVGAVGGDPVIEPARHHIRVGDPTRALRIGQPHQPGHDAGVPGAQPRWGPGVVRGVVLPQTTTGTLKVVGGALRGLGGVQVVVDRPPLELRDGQHRRQHPPRSPNQRRNDCPTATFTPRSPTRPHQYRTQCKCASADSLRREVGLDGGNYCGASLLRVNAGCWVADGSEMKGGWASMRRVEMVDFRACALRFFDRTSPFRSIKTCAVTDSEAIYSWDVDTGADRKGSDRHGREL